MTRSRISRGALVAAEPRVSIVIPVLADTSLLLACLDSIARDADAAIAHEVIVVANGTASPALAPLLARGDVTVIALQANLGFAVGSNLGAACARGQDLVFLNDDTEVKKGWLKALLACAQSADNIGAVAGRLLNLDNTLQEAGGVIWRGGRSHRYGFGDRADAARFMPVRDVDYASACGMLVTGPAWAAIGGFDEAFYPGYSEDVDLCMSLRRAGYRVVYEPTSVVRHRGSASSAPHFQQFIAERNRRLLVAKWPELDQRAEFPGSKTLAARMDAMVARPPQPNGKPVAVTTKPASVPTESALRDLEWAALRRELALKDAYVARMEREMATFRVVEKVMAGTRRVAQRSPAIKRMLRRVVARWR